MRGAAGTVVAVRGCASLRRAEGRRWLAADENRAREADAEDVAMRVRLGEAKALERAVRRRRGRTMFFFLWMGESPVEKNSLESQTTLVFGFVRRGTLAVAPTCPCATVWVPAPKSPESRGSLSSSAFYRPPFARNLPQTASTPALVTHADIRTRSCMRRSRPWSVMCG